MAGKEELGSLTAYQKKGERKECSSVSSHWSLMRQSGGEKEEDVHSETMGDGERTGSRMPAGVSWGGGVRRWCAASPIFPLLLLSRAFSGTEHSVRRPARAPTSLFPLHLCILAPTDTNSAISSKTTTLCQQESRCCTSMTTSCMPLIVTLVLLIVSKSSVAAAGTDRSAA